MKDDLEKLLENTKDRAEKIHILTSAAEYVLKLNPRNVDIDYVKTLIVCMRDYNEIPKIDELINRLKKDYITE